MMNSILPTQKKVLVIPLITTFLVLTNLAFADASWPRTEVDPTSAGFSEEGIVNLDAAMKQIVSDQDVAGMVWLLAKDGEVITFEAAGLSRVNDQATMEKDTLFRIYSMTKPVTGVALMMLHEEGLWEFDDPISKHIPEFANLKVLKSYDDEGNMELVPLDRQPTMRELLNHSAGFGYGLGGDDPVNETYRNQRVLASTNLNELVNKVASIPLLSQPGEQYYYSVAVDLQGFIVQKLSGQKFGDFLQERIFEPLSMVDTRFYVRDEDEHRFAEVHNWDEERSRLVQRPHRTDRPSYLDANRLESGGGGLVSSTHDYARFLQMLVNEGQLDGARILTPESIRIMRTNSLRDELNIGGGPDRPGRVGIGFGVDFAVIYDPKLAETQQGPGTYYWSGAAGTWFWIDPSQDMFWIGMIQAQGPRRPGAANMRNVAIDLIYGSLNE
ncbi:MAG: serine hydrolase [Gammaproteobacteria bacterium]|nr:serine hydrolase [Gammaproteobacteria bacterium]